MVPGRSPLRDTPRKIKNSRQPNRESDSSVVPDTCLSCIILRYEDGVALPSGRMPSASPFLLRRRISIDRIETIRTCNVGRRRFSHLLCSFQDLFLPRLLGPIVRATVAGFAVTFAQCLCGNLHNCHSLRWHLCFSLHLYSPPSSKF
jgi:hypothetical protein